MSTLESEYYESNDFWAGEALQDENNLSRIRETAGLIPPDTASLADVGCGNGVFVNYLQRAMPSLELFAIDRSRAALEYVRTPKSEGDIAAIPLPKHSYDCVTCLEVIEHLPLDTFQSALSELARVARKYIIVSVPYAENLEQNHTQCPQCKSIFNADLHLRTFSDDDILHLLDRENFHCVQTKKAGKQTSYLGHYRYSRLFYPEHFRIWRSPICPICGYRNGGAASTTTCSHSPHPKRRRSLISYFSHLPKLIWPQETTYSWIIGLYRRSP